MELEENGNYRLLKRVIAGLVGTGLAAMSLYVVRRRRRRRRETGSSGAAPIVQLPGNVSDLPAGDLYASLMACARALADPDGGDAALSRTASELSASPPDLAATPAERERWRGLCSRADLAMYAGAEIPPAGRESDVAFVRSLLTRSIARGTVQEA
jgi:hypothetical protein